MFNFQKIDFKKLTDQQILENVFSDEGKVIQYLFYTKCNSMFCFIIKDMFSSNHIERDELINELYLYLKENNWERLRKFEGRSKLTTWLSVVAVRFFINNRSRLIDSRGRNDLNIAHAENIASKTSHEHFIQNMDLYEAINKLKNPRDKFVILALEIEGRDKKEVAENLNTSIDNLYNISKRAKDRLSGILKDYDYAN